MLELMKASAMVTGIPEIPKARNLGFAIEPLGNVNGVYTYLLQYYWD
jgi:hypothetical protein